MEKRYHWYVEYVVPYKTRSTSEMNAMSSYAAGEGEGGRGIEMEGPRNALCALFLELKPKKIRKNWRVDF